MSMPPPADFGGMGGRKVAGLMAIDWGLIDIEKAQSVVRG